LPTPALAFYAQEQSAPAIMVTVSHIPFDRNGLKFYRHDGEISKADEQAILDAPASANYRSMPMALPTLHRAPMDSYVARYVNAFEKKSLQGLRIGFYQHSSAGRDIFTDVLAQLGVEVVPLKRTDYFVPIDTEAVSAEDRKLAIDWASADRFDAIISTDGDADRPLISDERGNWLRGDIVGLLCARTLGITQVVAPVNCISSIEATGEFSVVLRTRIGSPYVIAGMEQLEQFDGLHAGFEANGGFLLGSEVSLGNANLTALPTRDALLPILALLRLSLKSGKKLSEIVNALPQRFSESFRITEFPPSRSAALITALKENMSLVLKLLNPDALSITSINTVDGIRAQFNDGDIVHVRPSGNAPEFRCIAESTTSEKAKELCEGCLQRIATLPSDL
jgi:phosphomannomutase